MFSWSNFDDVMWNHCPHPSINLSSQFIFLHIKDIERCCFNRCPSNISLVIQQLQMVLCWHSCNISVMVMSTVWDHQQYPEIGILLVRSTIALVPDSSVVPTAWIIIHSGIFVIFFINTLRLRRLSIIGWSMGSIMKQREAGVVVSMSSHTFQMVKLCWVFAWLVPCIILQVVHHMT